MLYECDDNGDVQNTNIECTNNASCVQNDNFVKECVCNEGFTGDGLVECEGLKQFKSNSVDTQHFFKEPLQIIFSHFMFTKLS